MAPSEDQRAARRPLLAQPGSNVLTVVLVLVSYYAMPFSVDRSLVVRGLVALATLALLAVVTVRKLRRHDDPVGRLVTLIVIVVVAFAAVFYSLSMVENQFQGIQTRTDSLYFTVVTMATVGYGDIHATGQLARAVVILAVVFNLVFVGAIASAIATRVSVHSSPGPSAPGEADPDES